VPINLGVSRGSISRLSQTVNSSHPATATASSSSGSPTWPTTLRAGRKRNPDLGRADRKRKPDLRRAGRKRKLRGRRGTSWRRRSRSRTRRTEVPAGSCRQISRRRGRRTPTSWSRSVHKVHRVWFAAKVFVSFFLEIMLYFTNTLL
jgi:hypothetical protein